MSYLSEYSLYIAVILILSYFTYLLSKIYQQGILLRYTDKEVDISLYPIKGSLGSAGWDIFCQQDDFIEPHSRKLVDTKFSLQLLNSNVYLRVAPRSSLACKGIDIGAGVIDSDYRGHIKILMINTTNNRFWIKKGERIAQLIPEQIKQLPLVINQGDNGYFYNCKIKSKVRGMCGFGSTNN